jgi:hypothetical protein
MEIKMKIYCFDQNNSGGNFIDDENNGLGYRVYIEAIDADHANSIAEKIGIYFGGVGLGYDCECCGDRWYSVNEYDAVEKVPEFANCLWGVNSYFHPYKGNIQKLKQKNNG